ncbi:MAG TPA: hypothetical protein VIM07_05940 [Chitinophagaceae bacterium]
MKHLLFSFLLFTSAFGYAQKYVLIDKKMTQPVTYTNIVTLEHSYKNLFPVEKDKINQFIAKVEKIGAMLSDKNKSKVEPFDLYIGKTRFVGVKIPLAAEERLDVVLTTDCDGTKIKMHLSDAKISNVNNAFFINTWAKYIRGYVK